MNSRITSLFFTISALLFTSSAGAWEARVTDLLQHGDYVAVYLSPDPGPASCGYGQPYLLAVDGTPEANQRFSMLLTALVTEKTVAGYPDGCSSAIWAQSRPVITRLHLRGN